MQKNANKLIKQYSKKKNKENTILKSKEQQSNKKSCEANHKVGKKLVF